MFINDCYEKFLWIMIINMKMITKRMTKSITSCKQKLLCQDLNLTVPVPVSLSRFDLMLKLESRKFLWACLKSWHQMKTIYVIYCSSLCHCSHLGFQTCNIYFRPCQEKVILIVLFSSYILNENWLFIIDFKF